MDSRQRIGLVLSGGSLKAAAHIGAIHALSELGIHPQMVAGTSAGALVAALLAHGYTHQELLKLAASFNGRKMLDYAFPAASYVRGRLQHLLPARLSGHSRLDVPAGLFKGRKLARYIGHLFEQRQTIMPYFIVSTDLLSGQPVVFTNHQPSIDAHRAEPITDLKRSICASCALPGIFTSVELGSWLLVDGAVRHYAPVHVLRQAGCNRIIVVNLHVLKPGWQPEHILDVLLRSFEVMLRETIEDDTMGTDIVLLEPNVAHVKWTSFGEVQNCIHAGHDCVLQPQNRARLQALLANGPLLSVNGAPIS